MEIDVVIANDSAHQAEAIAVNPVASNCQQAITGCDFAAID
jgi:hypothetical protein